MANNVVVKGLKAAWKYVTQGYSGTNSGGIGSGNNIVIKGFNKAWKVITQGYVGDNTGEFVKIRFMKSERVTTLRIRTQGGL